MTGYEKIDMRGCGGKGSKRDENERVRRKDEEVFVSRGGREGCEGYKRMWRRKVAKGMKMKGCGGKMECLLRELEERDVRGYERMRKGKDVKGMKRRGYGGETDVIRIK